MDTEDDEVVNAVRELRDKASDMVVDLPWELWEGSEGGAGAVVVVGASFLLCVLAGARELTGRILDTNVLIKHLAILRSFVTLLAASKQESRPTLLIPHIVLGELDGLKNSTRMADHSAGTSSSSSQHSTYRRAQPQTSIGSLARAASTWLLSVLPGGKGVHEESPVVRGQRLKETLISASDRLYVADNDTRVLDACLFFRSSMEPQTRVILLSDDKNLCLRVKFEDVLAMSLDGIGDPQTLLERLDPTFATASNPRTSSSATTLPPPLPHAPRRTQYHSTPSLSSPPRQTSWNQNQLVPPPASTFAPPHPQPHPNHSNPGHSMSMELDEPPPPSFTPSPPPRLLPARDPSDVYRNVSLLIPHFLALPLFRHIFLHLQQTCTSSHSWRAELGEHSLWDAAACVRVARRWWTDGDVGGACLRGMERAAIDEGGTRKLPTSEAKSAGADQSTTPSRWAGSTQMPSSRVDKSAATKRVESLYRSLPSLANTLATPVQTTSSWSAPRFEVLLESVGELLCAVLGGLLNGEGVERDVKAVVEGWAGDLRSVGVALS